MSTQLSATTTVCSEYQRLFEESQRALEIWNEVRAEVCQSRLNGKAAGDELLRLQAKYARAYTLEQRHAHNCSNCQGSPRPHINWNLLNDAVVLTLFRNFGDENGVGLHGQRVGHAGQRLVEAGQQYAELGRRKAEGRKVEADLLVRCGHIQHDEDGFVLVATQIGECVGSIFVDGNVAAVAERRLAVTQRAELAVKALHAVRDFHFCRD